MSAPKLSVLTTCYNRESYISECIDSILNSSFQDFELILVDDRSSDRSWEIIQSYAAKDTRIITHRNEKNLGDYPNRNKAASLASGTYLKYVDADDVIGHFFLDILVHSMDQFPEAGVGLFGGKTWPHPVYLKPNEALNKYYSGEHTGFDRSPLMAIIQRDTFYQVGTFSNRAQTGDFEMWHKLSAHSGLILLPSLAWVRTHPNQQSEEARKDPTIRFRYLLVSLELLTSTLSDYPVEINIKLIRKKQRHIARTVLYCLKKHGIKTTLNFKRETNWSWLTICKYAFS